MRKKNFVLLFMLFCLLALYITPHLTHAVTLDHCQKLTGSGPKGLLKECCDAFGAVLPYCGPVLSGGGAGGPSPPIAVSSTEFANWIPVMLIAAIIGFSLEAIYYLLGVILNNNVIKARAIAEVGQFVESIFLVALILFIINIFGSATYSEVSVLSQAKVGQLCATLAGARLDFISNANVGGTDTPTKTLCDGVIKTAGASDITSNIDYGLASAYLILANLTNQTETNLNGVYLFEGYTGFLGQLRPQFGLCWPAISCGGVLSKAGVPNINTNLSYQPFAGYGIFRGVVFPVVSQAEIMFYMYLIQMIGIIVTLFSWPYLLAAGLFLRSTIFTRRIGGLIIAIVIVALIIYPLIFIFEYVSLSNVCSGAVTTNCVSPVGGLPASTTLQFHGYKPTGDTYSWVTGLTTSTFERVDYGLLNNMNFYVFPRVDYILTYDGCSPEYPTIISTDPNAKSITASSHIPFIGGLFSSTVVSSEVEIVGSYLVPGAQLIKSVLNFFPGGISSPVFSPTTFAFDCGPQQVITSLMDLEDLYGLLSVIGIILPIINILLAISATIGISYLLSGETNMLGISRLI